jgi:small-conductance mechanosensitive channel
MDRWFDRLHQFATTDRTVDAVRAIFIVLLTIVIVRFASRYVHSLVEKHGSAQRAAILARMTSWLIFAFGISAAVQELGFKIQVLLGAAGVFSVAIGFASQTTLSNIISGFFLFGERPFSIGDTVDVEGIVGEVLSIDLMSTALRTPDSRFVRIPNETLIKTKLTNLTRFPHRRLEVTVTVANDEDFVAIRERFLAIARRQELCRPEPEPQVFITSFGETSFLVQVWLWTRTTDLQTLRASFNEDVHQTLAGIRRSSLGTLAGKDEGDEARPTETRADGSRSVKQPQS